MFTIIITTIVFLSIAIVSYDLYIKRETKYQEIKEKNPESFDI